jgi:hypothetical protein
MFSECANPECRSQFDYHQGAFFRFHSSVQSDGRPANTHSVRHLWLCGRCSKAYYLEHVQNRGILLRSRTHAFDPAARSILIGAA